MTTGFADQSAHHDSERHDPEPVPAADELAPADGGIRSVARRARVVASTVVAAVLGLLPHVLHHVGPLAGAALFAGVGGSLLFGALGLALSIPFLLRVHQRCGDWRIPAVLLVTFAAVFSVSTFVVGPAISGGDDAPAPAVRAPGATPQAGAHEDHHR